MSPTERTQARLRDHGYEVANCEKKVPTTPLGFKGPLVTRDLFGFIDTLALNPRTFDAMLAVQTTTSTHHATHKQKILASPITKVWLRHARLEIWSWSKGLPANKPRHKKTGLLIRRKVWKLRRERFKLDTRNGQSKVSSYEVAGDTPI